MPRETGEARSQGPWVQRGQGWRKRFRRLRGKSRTEPLGGQCVHLRGTHSCGRDDGQGQNPNIYGAGGGRGRGGVREDSVRGTEQGEGIVKAI